MKRFQIWIKEWLGLYESINYLNREIQDLQVVQRNLDQTCRNIYEKINAEKTNREHLVGRVQELESWAFNLQNAGWLRRGFLGVELPK